MAHGISQSGGFSAADISGDKGHGPDSEGVIEALFDAEKLLGLEDIKEFALDRIKADRAALEEERNQTRPPAAALSRPLGFAAAACYGRAIRLWLRPR